MSKAEEFLKNKGFTRQVHTTNGVSYDTLCRWLSEYAEHYLKENCYNQVTDNFCQLLKSKEQEEQ